MKVLRLVVIIAVSVVFVSPSPTFGLGPLGVPDPSKIEYPGGEPPSDELVQLGKVLFFDPRLSINDQQSCATCHNPDLGFGDGMASGLGTMGDHLGRNVPHLYNLAWNSNFFFWDGRSASLEEQALGPIQAGGEMNMPLATLIPKLKAVPYYERTFNELFPVTGVTAENVGNAIAAFERTIITNNSPFDRYMQGDFSAMSPAAIRGLALFEGKALCAACHNGANFTDERFHNIGLGDADRGRAAIEEGAANEGAFKTPGLRNALLTTPYMHDGSLASLEDVLRHYNKGGNKVESQDPLVRPLNLIDQEIYDLLAFLGALTDPVTIQRPQIP